ncbi:MAG: nucleotide exchange factor GrpE [Erysipelotrichaceae bacterium]
MEDTKEECQKETCQCENNEHECGCENKEHECGCENKEHECGCENKEHANKHDKKKEKKDHVTKLEAKITDLEKELEVSKNAYFKAYADTENAKKRLSNEADNARKYRLQSFGVEILPILDSFERALQVKNDDETIKNYVKGFEMIHTQLVGILEKEGVSEIDALNKPFDPNFHQALMQEPVEGVEAGIVVEVLQKGYMLKDRILRPTLVKVSE